MVNWNLLFHNEEGILERHFEGLNESISSSLRGRLVSSNHLSALSTVSDSPHNNTKKCETASTAATAFPRVACLPVVAVAAGGFGPESLTNRLTD